MTKKVVIDTNVILVSISSRSSLHWVIEALKDETYILCVTTDILAEYAEIIGQHMGVKIANSVLNLITNLPNIELITTYYRFNLLKDPDDNKFVDCAIAANAEYIVSHDSDFKVLEKIPFPSVQVISASLFKEYLES